MTADYRTRLTGNAHRHFFAVRRVRLPLRGGEDVLFSAFFLSLWAELQKVDFSLDFLIKLWYDATENAPAPVFVRLPGCPGPREEEGSGRV